MNVLEDEEEKAIHEAEMEPTPGLEEDWINLSGDDDLKLNDDQ
jgi:hypothetical protein